MSYALAPQERVDQFAGFHQVQRRPEEEQVVHVRRGQPFSEEQHDDPDWEQRGRTPGVGSTRRTLVRRLRWPQNVPERLQNDRKLQRRTPVFEVLDVRVDAPGDVLRHVARLAAQATHLRQPRDARA